MKKLKFIDLASILQDSVEEDLLYLVDEETDTINFEDSTLAESEETFIHYLLIKLFDNYDPEASNASKTDSFLSVLEDIRSKLDEIELSLENWEDIIEDDGEAFQY